jgi:tripartite-type tricarboxylate transporter receptor subunit TctC
VSVLAASPQILVTSKKFPAKSVKELIEMGKSGKQINFALTGVSGMQALAAALFESQAGIKFTKVPYKGAGAALPDLIGGTVDIMFDNPGSSLPNVTGGRLDLLATTSLERMPALKTTETVSETLKGFEALNWFVLAAPAGTPKDVLDKINAAATQAIKSNTLKPFIESNGIIIIADKPEQAQAFINSDVEKWSKLVKQQGLQLE